jgi:hypothetical protein
MPLTPEERADRQRAYGKRWYEKNKDRVLARQKAYQAGRREKSREYQRRWFEKNREKERLRARAKNWRVAGLPEPTRPEPDVCECCGKKCHRALALDHCHESGAFRGWLCSKCNLGIGKLGDTIESPERAVAYLRRAKQ